MTGPSEEARLAALRIHEISPLLGLIGTFSAKRYFEHFRYAFIHFIHHDDNSAAAPGGSKRNPFGTGVSRNRRRLSFRFARETGSDLHLH